LPARVVPPQYTPIGYVSVSLYTPQLPKPIVLVREKRAVKVSNQGESDEEFAAMFRA